MTMSNYWGPRIIRIAEMPKQITKIVVILDAYLSYIKTINTHEKCCSKEITGFILKSHPGSIGLDGAY